jgi:hypothetical protein
MGIFGFLSKAHMDQGIPTGDVAAQIQLIDEKINIQKELISSERQNIEAARNTLSQMDAQLTARLDRGDSEASVERAVQIRAQQRRERNTLNNEIAAAQKRIETSNLEIQKLNLEKAPIAASFRKIEAEVGPIKYIAALIYGDNPDTATLERAVRWVIILLIFVFDPLALILVIAAISSYKWEFEQKKEEKIEKFVETGSDGYLPLTEGELEARPNPLPVPINEDKEQEQVSPVKKKLIKITGKGFPLNLKKFDLIKIRLLFAVRTLKEKFHISKLSSSPNLQKLKYNLSWNQLTNWSKSPTLRLLKKLNQIIKKS